LLTHEEADKVETSHVHGGTSETAGDSGEPEGTDENVALWWGRVWVSSIWQGRRGTGRRTGPNRSHRGPATRRTSKLATPAMMFELAISPSVKFMSRLMVTLRSGGMAYYGTSM